LQREIKKNKPDSERVNSVAYIQKFESKLGASASSSATISSGPEI